MSKELLNRILITVSLLLVLAAIVFLCFSIFGSSDTTTDLACALACILLSNLFNLVRCYNNKK